MRPNTRLEEENPSNKKKEFKVCYNLQTLSRLSAPGLDQETQEEPCNRQGPLPDLLPQTEHLSRLSSPLRGPNDLTLQLRVRRTAIQLRTIGDEFNATLLHRAVRGQAQRVGTLTNKCTCFSQTFTGTAPVSHAQPSSCEHTAGRQASGVSVCAVANQ